MSVLNHLSDIADFANETWPFPKMSLGSLGSRLGVGNLNSHDALGDASPQSGANENRSLAPALSD
jgi:hypothetical protein